MAKKSKRIDKGIILTPDTDATSEQGELKYNDSEKRLKYRDDAGEQEVLAKDKAQEVTNKTIDSASNTITIDADEATVSELETDNFKAGVVDTDGTLTAPSDTKLPTSQAVKTYVDAQIQTKDEASEISYDNATSGLTATDVQAAVDEVEGRVDTAESNISTNASNLSDHLADAVDAHDSSAISYDNTTSGLTATDAQAAIDEVEGRVDTVETAASGAQTSIDNHIADADDAHDASAISNVPAGNLAATDVQGALNELQTDIDTRALASDLSDHIADAVDAHDASAISNVPSGNLAATDVQSALDELQTDIDTRATDADLTAHTGATSGVHGVTGDVVGTTDAQTLTQKAIQAPTRLDAKPDTLANLTVYATTATNGELLYATDTKEYFGVQDGSLVALGGGGGGTEFSKEQVAHGFAVLDAIYHNGTSWVKAQGDDANTLAQYVVTEVLDVDNFKAANFGKFEITAHGKTVGEFYFLSETTAGGSEITEGEIYSAPLYYVEDANNIHVLVYRPSLKPQLTQFREDVDLLSNILDFDTTSAGFSLETTVNGETFRLQHTGGSTRFAEKTLECTPKFRNKQLQVNVDITSTASSGNFKVIVTDETNATTLADEQLIYLGDSPTEKKTVIFNTASTTASIKVRFEALQESGSPVSDFDDITVGLSKTEVKEIVTLAQEENVFSARIANNGSASILSQSKPSISSVNRVATGQVDVTFVAGFFTEIPSVIAQPVRSLTGSGDRNMIVTNLSTSGCRITSQVANNGTDIDNDFDITVTRQGADYKNLERRVERTESSFKEILVEKPESEIRVNTGNGAGSTNTRIRRFSNLYKNIGSDITYVDSSTDGASFTVNTDGHYSITYTENNIAGVVDIGISKNSTELSTNISSINALNRLAYDSGNGTSENVTTVSWSGYLQAGDVIRPHTNGTPTSTGVNVDFYIAKAASLEKVSTAPDSKIEIPTSEVRFEGASGLGSGTEDNAVQFSNLTKLRGDAFSIDNSNGTAITMLKDGKLTISASCSLSAVGGLYLTKNNPDRSIAVPADQYIIGLATGNNGYFVDVSSTLDVSAGDSFHVISNNGVNSNSSSTLRLHFQEQRISVAVSNVTPQFEDADSMVRVLGGNGTGSVNQKIRRFSSVDSNIGSDITYTDSATDGASFVVNKTGFYTISYTDDDSTARYLGISKNASDLTLSINDVSFPQSERLAMSTTATGTYVESTSWSGILNEGDVIRAHSATDGTPNGTYQVSFTIAKVGVPSIAEVDVTPFVDYHTNTVERQSLRYDGFAGFGSTGTVIPYFSNLRESNGSSLLSIENSPVNGFSVTALKDCTVNASWSNQQSSSNFGFSLNASSISTTFTALDNSEILAVENSANTLQTVSTTVRLKAGDILRPHTNSNAAGNTSFHNITITAEADEVTKERLYSIEQAENEFSARISNDGTASIISQSLPFIQSVNRISTGLIEVNFIPGFFTETPSVIFQSGLTATQHFFQVLPTVDGFQMYSRNSAGTPVDSDFEIAVSRQGSDRKDLQQSIVQLSDFPRVNRTLTQEITHNAAHSTLLDRAGEIRYNSANFTSSGTSIIAVEDDAANTRTKFVAQRDCIIDMSLAHDVTATGSTISILRDSDSFQMATAQSYSSSFIHTNARMKLSQGDFVTVQVFTGQLENNANECQLLIAAEAQDLEITTNTENIENAYSARIANNGTASITDQSVPFIDSVTRTGTGVVNITFVAGFFTEIPSINATSIGDNNQTVCVNNVSTSGCTVNSRAVTTGSSQDFGFDIIVQRQGDDYTSIQDVAVSVLGNKFQTKTLSANVSTTGDIAELQFNNLVVGKTYNIGGVISFANSGTYRLGFRDSSSGGGNLYGENNFGTGTSAGIRQSPNLTFVATSSTLYANCNFVSGGSIQGDGTLQETHITLTELNNTIETTDFS